MYYRLNCVLESGQSRGYQWREIDQATFVAIATGTRPVGDEIAQTRDSTEYDTAAGNRTIYYGAVWKPGSGWINQLTATEAQDLYVDCGQERAGA